jgi:glycosyltransferase involved in cell wall biosynthesis
LEWSTRWNCHAAKAIIAVSHATRHDLIERLGVPPDTIRVIHHGVSPEFSPATPERINQIRTEYRLPEFFILAVGSLHPRKNLARLIQAFERIAPEMSDLALVLSGASGWTAEEILERAWRSPFSRRIFYIGYVSDGDLPALYSAAAVTAFVSLYEGFGLPAVESMACGTPVVAANRSSLPEICGGAALLADPFDPESIAAALRRVFDDAQLRQRMIELGIARAASLTWQSSALQTLAFLRAIRDNSL